MKLLYSQRSIYLATALIIFCLNVRAQSSSRQLLISEVRDDLFKISHDYIQELQKIENNKVIFYSMVSNDYKKAYPLCVKNENFYHLTYLASEVIQDSVEYFFSKYIEQTIQEKKHLNKDKLASDFDFVPNCRTIIDSVYESFGTNIHYFDTAYRSEISKMYTEDQSCRKQTEGSLTKRCYSIDSLNAIKFDSLFSLYGWPGEGVIGPSLYKDEHVRPAILVIHRSDIDVYLKYLDASIKSFQTGQDKILNIETIVTNFLYRFRDIDDINYLPFLKTNDENEIDIQGSTVMLSAIKSLTLDMGTRNFELLLDNESQNFLVNERILKQWIEKENIRNLKLVSIPFQKVDDYCAPLRNESIIGYRERKKSQP